MQIHQIYQNKEIKFYQNASNTSQNYIIHQNIINTIKQIYQNTAKHIQILDTSPN